MNSGDLGNSSEARVKPAVKTGANGLGSIEQILPGPVQLEPGSRGVALYQRGCADRARILIIFDDPGKADSHDVRPVTYCYVEPSH